MSVVGLPGLFGGSVELAEVAEHDCNRSTGMRHHEHLPTVQVPAGAGDQSPISVSTQPDGQADRVVRWDAQTRRAFARSHTRKVKENPNLRDICL